MSTIPYLSHGFGVPLDEFTGLPKKKKQQPRAWGPGGPGWQAFQGLPSGGGGGSTSGGGGSGFGGGPPGFSIPGFTPDFKALVENDPFYSLTAGDLAADSSVDRNSLLANVQRGLVNYGGSIDPAKLLGGSSPLTGILGEVLTPETQQLMQKNTAEGLSYAAKSRRQFDDSLRQIRNALAARGALRSGELGYHSERLAQAQKEGDNEATERLLQYLQDNYGQYLGAERGRDAARRTAAQEAADRQAAYPQNQYRDPVEFKRGGDGLYHGGGRSLRPLSGELFEDVSDGTRWTLNPDGTISRATGGGPADDREQRPNELSPWRNGYVDNTVQNNTIAAIRNALGAHRAA